VRGSGPKAAGASVSSAPSDRRAERRARLASTLASAILAGVNSAGAHARRARIAGAFIGALGWLVACGHERAPGAIDPGADDASASEELAASPAHARAFAPGRLSLRVRAPDGNPWIGANAVYATPLAGGGDELELSDAQHSGPDLVASLGPGRWRIRVDPDGRASSPGDGRNPRLARCGEAAAECEIRSNATTALEIRLRKGGRLRLTLALPSGFSDAELDVVRTCPVEQRCFHALDLAHAKEHNRCSIVRANPRAGAATLPVSFFAPECVGFTIERFIPGTTALSQTFFDAGVYTLHAETTGFFSVDPPFEIVDGKDTELSIELKPRDGAK
jgi:hypothetical protein